MSLLDIGLLLAISAVWGSSFMFMRYLAPTVGPAFTADMRTLIAGIVLGLFFLVIRFRPGWKKNAGHFVIIGLLNAGVPALLYSFAALSLPASVEAILNALSPLFGAVFSAIWLGERLTIRKILGLALGLAGVACVTGLATGPGEKATLLPIGACVMATVCYGLAGVYIKKKASHVKPTAVAGGSQLAAGLIMLPLVFLAPPPTAQLVRAAPVIILFALLCNAAAFLMYFRLIASAGPTKALTVTFLIPVSGMALGALLLLEPVTTRMVIGTIIILAGSALVVAPGFLDRAGAGVYRFMTTLIRGANREQRFTARGPATPVDGPGAVREDPPGLP